MPTLLVKHFLLASVTVFLQEINISMCRFLESVGINFINLSKCHQSVESLGTTKLEGKE